MKVPGAGHVWAWLAAVGLAGVAHWLLKGTWGWECWCLGLVGALEGAPLSCCGALGCFGGRKKK